MKVSSEVLENAAKKLDEAVRDGMVLDWAFSDEGGTVIIEDTSGGVYTLHAGAIAHNRTKTEDLLQVARYLESLDAHNAAKKERE